MYKGRIHCEMALLLFRWTRKFSSSKRRRSCLLFKNISDSMRRLWIKVIYSPYKNPCQWDVFLSGKEDIRCQKRRVLKSMIASSKSRSVFNSIVNWLLSCGSGTEQVPCALLLMSRYSAFSRALVTCTIVHCDKIIKMQASC
jgi:hypothetical protein